jgi:hypothetical protein
MDELADLHLSVIGGYDQSSEPLLVDLPSATSSKKRGPPNAFLLYCIENRADVRAENPEKPNIEISRILADRWKEMDEDLRTPYRLRAQAQQSEFKQICPDYKYDKAKLKRSKRPLDYDPKHYGDLPDIVTLVNLPLDELRACINLLQGQFLMSCQQTFPQFLQGEAADFSGIDTPFTHDGFQTGQQ